jgi:hypothetical protein
VGRPHCGVKQSWQGQDQGNNQASQHESYNGWQRGDQERDPGRAHQIKPEEVNKNDRPKNSNQTTPQPEDAALSQEKFENETPIRSDGTKQANLPSALIHC